MVREVRNLCNLCLPCPCAMCVCIYVKLLTWVYKALVNIYENGYGAASGGASEHATLSNLRPGTKYR